MKAKVVSITQHESIVAALPDVIEAIATANPPASPRPAVGFGGYKIPSRDAIESILDDLRAAFFPRHFGGGQFSERSLRTFVGHRLDVALFQLQEQIGRGLAFGAGGEANSAVSNVAARDLVRDFARRLPDVRALLGSDVMAAFAGDPAASSPDEAIFCYPGVAAILHHRVAHELYRLGAPIIPRMISEVAHAATGIDIHPGATIGGSFFIDHGTGVVIGETAVIGNRVRIYQGVTLGARNFPTDHRGCAIKGHPRHPIVEDDVTIYAGATILGRITIGRGSRIGGNVWLTRAVPPGSSISQAQVRSDLFEGGSGI